MLRQSSERLLNMECACSSADRVPGYEPVGRGFESPGARIFAYDMIPHYFNFVKSFLKIFYKCQPCKNSKANIIGYFIAIKLCLLYNKIRIKLL